MFYIGHPAYKGVNRYAIAYTKAEAVRILRDRGVKRDAARIGLIRALAGEHVTFSAGLQGYDVVELIVRDHPSDQLHPWQRRALDILTHKSTASVDAQLGMGKSA